MARADKARRIIDILDELYPTTPVPLDHVDPYTLLVAVLLSAQCTDERVNKVTPALFEVGPNPVAMVRLDVDEIREIIRPCGLSPTKARNIHALSQLLLDQHGGEVPADQLHLEALPGVGHKTAQVVMAQAFGVPSFPVDTHIHRLAWRWGLSNGTAVDHTERDLKALFPRESWNALHLQIIFFGRQFCTARAHDPGSCPICSWAGVKKRLSAEQAHGNHSAARKALARQARAAKAARRG